MQVTPANLPWTLDGLRPTAGAQSGSAKAHEDEDHKPLGAFLRFPNDDEEVAYCAFAAEQWQRGLDLLVLLLLLAYLGVSHLSPIIAAQKQLRAVLLLVGPPALVLGLRGLRSVPLHWYITGREGVLVALRLLGVVYDCWDPTGQLVSKGVFQISWSVMALSFLGFAAMVRLHIHVPLQLLSCCVVIANVVSRAPPPSPRFLAQAVIQQFLCGFVIPTLATAAVEWSSRLAFLERLATLRKEK
jgi:hypothetical protein